MTKHLFVTGGVVSGLGKGLTAASLGRLLKTRGLRVTMLKLDPYLNVDPGTMNPFEHGEVFVTEDGGETDLDLGHYERFIDENLTRESNGTTGSIYSKVIAAERHGDYLGRTVQVIPHITDEIKRRISRLASADVDVVITEVGGTVGDIEILPFLEAIRQFRLDVGRENVYYVHVTLVPFVGPLGEQKTKPVQHSVTELRSRGVQPDAIVCRCVDPLTRELEIKISSLCDVPIEAVVTCPDAASLYEIPLILHAEGLDDVICRRLGIDTEPVDLSEWEALVGRIHDVTTAVRIGLIGKYTSLPDAYLSVIEALNHAGIHQGASVEIERVQAEDVEGLLVEGHLRDLDGIVIPGGFGERGIEGKIAAAGYARENRIPCLGLCLGMQAMTIEYARNALGLLGAHSTEFDNTAAHPVIDLMESQRSVTHYGGTMRLGAHVAQLRPDSMVADLYGEEVVSERHRHRYEFNPRYRTQFEDSGMVPSGESPDGLLVEFMELRGHPFWVGTQSHPEFKSRPNRPAPLFSGLIHAAIERAATRRRPTGRHQRPGRRSRPLDLTLMTGGFRKTSERVLHAGRIISLTDSIFVTPNGDEMSREIVHHPGSVAVVPIDGDDVLLLRQYRTPLEFELLEIPAGTRDVDGESAADTARRELIEEAGFACESVEELVTFHNSPGFCDETSTIFVATGLSSVPRDPDGAEEEWMTVERFGLDDVAAMIERGEIRDAKTIIGVLLARQRLGR